MQRLSEQTPKPLLRVSGKPLMQYMLELLVSHGVRKIGVNLFYRGEEIASYFGDGSRFGVELVYVREPALSGTAGGVLAIANVIKPKSDFFVVAADMLVDFDLSALSKAHQAHAAIATMACYFRPRDQLHKSGVVLFDPGSFEVTQFVERPKSETEIVSQWVNSSVYCFSPKILPLISQALNASGSTDLPTDIFPTLLSQGKSLFAYPFDEKKFYQLGIDTPERIARAEADIASGRFGGARSGVRGSG